MSAVHAVPGYGEPGVPTGPATLCGLPADGNDYAPARSVLVTCPDCLLTRVKAAEAERDEAKADRQFLIRIYEERISAERRGTHDRLNKRLADAESERDRLAAEVQQLRALLAEQVTSVENELWLALTAANRERDEARAALARVQALASEHWDWKSGQVLAAKLRAAIARPEPAPAPTGLGADRPTSNSEAGSVGASATEPTGVPSFRETSAWLKQPAAGQGSAPNPGAGTAEARDTDYTGTDPNDGDPRDLTPDGASDD